LVLKNFRDEKGKLGRAQNADNDDVGIPSRAPYG
jgi:hypothetical protein